jgi:hypothetical protein
MKSTPVSPDRFEAERLRSYNFRCDDCGYRYPERLARQMDGRVVCLPNCFYPGGRTARDLKRAEAASYAGQRAAEGARQALYGGITYPVVAVTSLSADPVELTIGGANKTLVLTGVGHSADDVITYSSASVEDAAAVSRTSTATTLTLRAPGGATPGYYDLSFNGDVFRNAIRVKA